MRYKYLLSFAVLYILAIQPVQGSVFYTYTGNTFNDIAAGTQFDSTMNVTGYIELPSLLGANETAISPISFSFSNGLTTIDTTSAVDSSLSTLSLTTDGLGNVTKWNITLYTDWLTPATVGDTRDIISSMNTTGSIRDAGVVQQCLSISGSGKCVSANAPERAYIYDSPGSWSVSAVPIPAAIWLFCSGLIGLIAVARRKVVNNHQ